MQPLVRDAAERGSSTSAITSELRCAYGRAYRRADLLDDIRSYRSAPLPASPASAAIETALTTYRDLRGFIARIGVAAFSISLIVPTLVHSSVSGPVTIASTLDQRLVAHERVAIPNARDVAGSEATASPDPTPTPTIAPPVYVTMPNGMNGVVVTASWYGPGFYDNRLPCWQWLQANGQPIQLEPDTWGVANKTLPCGTMLTLSHGPNVITVPVVDRGPYVAGRELDLSLRVRTALGCSDLCTVVMHIGQ